MLLWNERDAKSVATGLDFGLSASEDSLSLLRTLVTVNTLHNICCSNFNLALPLS